MKNRRSKIAGILLTCCVAAAGLGASGALAPAFAQEGEGDDQPRRRSETLDPATAKVLQEVFTAMQEERYQAALALLNQLVNERGDRMKPFDMATTMQMRASVKVNLEDYRGALGDFQRALSANALPPETNNQLRYYIAQIQFQLEDYQAAINGLNEWIRSAQSAGQPVDANAYYLLAAAYTQVTPPNYRAALDPAEKSVAALKEPKKGNYDLLNLIYSELGQRDKRGALLERMVNYWPGEKSYWTQLSGIYNQMGRDGDAFAVLEVAYRAGLLSSESEMLTLVQYYSFYENPFRGAKVLEQEIAAGTVKRTVKNLTLLSQLWSQAREHKRAIPVLQDASKMSDTGELSFRLGQVLLADEQYAASERALRAALNKGGMKREMTGETWLLLGTAVFSQAGPEDREIRTKAREAFVRATNYDNTSKQARQWVAYIDAIIATEKAQDKLEKQQRDQAMRDEIERVRTSLQVCRLQGRDPEECAEIEKRMKDLMKRQAAGEALPESARNQPDSTINDESSNDAQPADDAEPEAEKDDTE